MAEHGGFAELRSAWDAAAQSDGYRAEIAGTDDEGYWERSGWHDAERLARLCPGHRDLDLVEWGCGAGRVTRYLAFLFRSVLAVDIAPGMLERVRGLDLPDTEVALTHGDDLRPIQVDVVYSSQCLMHCRKADVPAILAAWRRALRPGGRALFHLPCYQEPREPAGYRGMGIWTPGELRDLATQTDFEVVSLAENPGAFDFTTLGPRHGGLHEFRPQA